MKVTNGDIWQAAGAIKELCQAPWIPVKVSYRLAKLARKLENHHRDIDRVRVSLINRFGSPDERGRYQITPDSPKWAEFEAGWNELMADTTEMDVSPVVLPAVDGATLKPALLAALLTFLEVEE